MPIIGLTGGIGSGKSLAAKQFASLGVPIVDTDLISHALTAPSMPMVTKIGEMFGPDYLKQGVTLNRTKLRELVFSNTDARQQLEAIMHPAIRTEALKQLEENAKSASLKYQLLVVPLLFETNHYAEVVNQVLVIDCPPALQIERVLKRTGNAMTVTDIEAVMKVQLSREARLAKADLVIMNDGTPETLMVDVHKMHARLSKNCLKYPQNAYKSPKNEA
jgi:dephospho-CoA kinase